MKEECCHAIHPFHFGPGLLLKAAMPRQFSFFVFAVTQVVIDLETLYHLIRQEWPLHRAMHSYVGATTIGTVTGLLMYAVFRVFSKLFARTGTDAADPLVAEIRRGSFVGAMLGGLIGGASHTLLDSIMHQDVQPLWPFASGNGLLRAISVPGLHCGCMVACLAGIGIMLVNRPPRIGD